MSIQLPRKKEAEKTSGERIQELLEKVEEIAQEENRRREEEKLEEEKNVKKVTPKTKAQPKHSKPKEKTKSKTTTEKETKPKKAGKPKKETKPKAEEKPKKEKTGKSHAKEEKKEKESIEKKETKKETNTKKQETKELIVSKGQLEKIQEEIKRQKAIPEERKKKINRKIFPNLILAVVVVLYFLFINLGMYNIKPETFLKDLQVFSMITIGITIIVFEKAYKKDSTEFTIYGIESLALAITTLMTIYIGMYYPTKFSAILNAIAIVFAIYYVGKSIVIYYKMVKKVLKSDIRKIIEK